MLDVYHWDYKGLLYIINSTLPIKTFTCERSLNKQINIQARLQVNYCFISLLYLIIHKHNNYFKQEFLKANFSSKRSWSKKVLSKECFAI